MPVPASDLCLVDGPFGIPMSIPQKCIIQGDSLSQSISAASIVAKVYRDRIMCAYHEQFPVYGFSENKGYATPGTRHLEKTRALSHSPGHLQRGL